MLYLEHRPTPPLSGSIKSFWYCEGYRPAHRQERVLPQGAVQVVINLAQDRISNGEQQVGNNRFLSPMLVAGVHSQFMVIDTSSLQQMIGIQFLPGGSIPFFGVPTDEL